MREREETFNLNRKEDIFCIQEERYKQTSLYLQINI